MSGDDDEEKALADAVAAVNALTRQQYLGQDILVQIGQAQDALDYAKQDPLVWHDEGIGLSVSDVLHDAIVEIKRLRGEIAPTAEQRPALEEILVGLQDVRIDVAALGTKMDKVIDAAKLAALRAMIDASIARGGDNSAEDVLRHLAERREASTVRELVAAGRIDEAVNLTQDAAERRDARIASERRGSANPDEEGVSLDELIEKHGLDMTLNMGSRPRRIGVATYEEFKARTMEIARRIDRGERPVAPDDPNLWFPTIEAAEAFVRQAQADIAELRAAGQAKPDETKEGGNHDE